MERKEKSAVQKIKAVAILLGLLIPTLSTLAKPLEADEARDVAGKYKLVVGFVHEPAFTDERNGVELQVLTSPNGTPVQGLEKTLAVKVTYEGAGWSLNLKFRPDPSKAGVYAAYFLPTRSGKFVFNIMGDIEGSPIDERFESGPDTFKDVEPIEPLEYPDHRNDER